MTALKLLYRNLIYYRRFHIWTVLGAAMSTAIIAGALIIGDSVRFSLRQIVFDRLGSTQYALDSGDRFIRSDIANKLSEKLGTSAAPLLMTRGIAIAGGGERRAGNIQIAGVDRNLAAISGSAVFDTDLAPGEAIVNDQLASRLDVSGGDEILLRIDNLDYIPKDLSWAPDTDVVVSKRYRVKAVVTRDDFGGFSLETNQTAPNTVFLSLDTLAGDMGIENKSNVLLVSARPEAPITETEITEALSDIWSIGDAGYTLESLPGQQRVALGSARIFLDNSVADKALELYPDSQRLFSYFVNEFEFEGRSTPYSFVSAFSGSGLADNGIIINEWLANDLGAAEGDSITLAYYVPGPGRSLIEEKSSFIIKSVVPIEGKYADRDMVPDFPGFSDADNCRSWEPGIPVDLDKIRDTDEEYWDRYRSTPKAFVSLDTAQKLWGNRYGSLTGIRFASTDSADIDKVLSQAIDPAALGLYFRDVRQEGLTASSHSTGFDQLFLGLSFFIVAAALLLTGLLFVFSIEQRTEEIGLLSALGFPKKAVRRLILSEGAVLSVMGAVAGALAGLVYNQALLLALKSVWRDIVGTTSLEMHVRISTVLMAVFSGITVNLITILAVTRKRLNQPVSDLQKGITQVDTFSTKPPRISLAAGLASLAGIVVIFILYGGANEREMMMPFFLAGALFLIGGLASANYILTLYSRRAVTGIPGIFSISVRNTTRKKSRSLAVIAMLAIGIFIVFTVGANRRNASLNAEDRASGTGGFALFGETAIPVLYDLNSAKGRNFYSLNDLDSTKVSFVPFRIRDGSDASCLNLNRVSNPQLAAVDPELISRRKAFSFAETVDDVDPDNVWQALDDNIIGDVIPGIADNTVIVWGLGKAVGDTLDYRDEQGNEFKIRLIGGLANSVFQGNVIISDKAFTARYPSISGSRLFLVDAPFDAIDEVSKTISWALEDQGAELTKTAARLALFNRIENTYLSIFLILGTFGLLLGSVGIGLVIGRNVSERRGELALLRAVGFEQNAVRSLIISEHGLLMFAGIAVGSLSALMSTLPSLMMQGSNVPFMTILLFIAAITVNGAFWTYSAARLATGKDLYPSLRTE